MNTRHTFTTANRVVVTIALLLIIVCTAHGKTNAATYSREDSLKITGLLQKSRHLPIGENLMLHFARQFLGVPYTVATLEVNPIEQLVVNTRGMDCTTLVETVVALTLASQRGQYTWADFCHWLETIRYDHGQNTGYQSRNHYFSQWIESNSALGLAHEIVPGNGEKPNAWVEKQHLDLHFMSRHPEHYPMLRDDTMMQAEIGHMEVKASGRTVSYIPKRLIGGDRRQLPQIQDGDILAIVTRKDGLDTSHVGIAVWGRDGKLHLLNASQIHHKVILEPMTLYQYMQKHTSQTGIRVIRVL